MYIPLLVLLVVPACQEDSGPAEEEENQSHGHTPKPVKLDCTQSYTESYDSTRRVEIRVATDAEGKAEIRAMVYDYINNVTSHVTCSDQACPDKVYILSNFELVITPLGDMGNGYRAFRVKEKWDMTIRCVPDGGKGKIDRGNGTSSTFSDPGVAFPGGTSATGGVVINPRCDIAYDASQDVHGKYVSNVSTDPRRCSWAESRAWENAYAKAAEFEETAPPCPPQCNNKTVLVWFDKQKCPTPIRQGRNYVTKIKITVHLKVLCLKSGESVTY
jgi:hypothetical protein